MSNYSGHQVLELMSAHAKNRNAWIESLIIQELELADEQQKTILEFGAGLGEFCFRLKKYKNLEIELVESDQRYFSMLSNFFRSYRSIGEITTLYDCIYLIDVLEHLENEDVFLKKFYDLLKPGGRLFIFVPARMELFSDFDTSIGHFRRYNKSELNLKLRSCGFTITRSCYSDFPGYILMLFQKLLFRHTHPTPFSVKAYDRLFVPVSRWVEKIVHLPIGKSIRLTAKREK